MVEQHDDMTRAFVDALESPAEDAPQAESSPAVTDATPDEAAETSAPDAPVEDTTADATVQPVSEERAEDSVTTTETPKGEPPRERWDAILNNQRKAAADEARKQVEEQYAWARDIPDHERQALLGLYQGLRTNPQDTIQRLTQAHRASVPSSPPPDPEPQPDLENKADGSLVYSAPQQKKWAAWRERQFERRLSQQLYQQVAPIQRSVQQYEAQQAEARMGHLVSSLEQVLPGFKERRQEVAKIIQGDQQLYALSGVSPREAVEVAYGRLMRQSSPERDKALREQITAEVVASFQQKAAAGSSNPAQPNVSTPKKFKGGARGFEQALEHFSR